MKTKTRRKEEGERGTDIDEGSAKITFGWGERETETSVILEKALCQMSDLRVNDKVFFGGPIFCLQITAITTPGIAVRECQMCASFSLARGRMGQSKAKEWKDGRDGRMEGDKRRWWGGDRAGKSETREDVFQRGLRIPSGTSEGDSPFRAGKGKKKDTKSEIVAVHQIQRSRKEGKRNTNEEEICFE